MWQLVGSGVRLVVAATATTTAAATTVVPVTDTAVTVKFE